MLECMNSGWIRLTYPHTHTHTYILTPIHPHQATFTLTTHTPQSLSQPAPPDTPAVQLGRVSGSAATHPTAAREVQTQRYGEWRSEGEERAIGRSVTRQHGSSLKCYSTNWEWPEAVKGDLPMHLTNLHCHPLVFVQCPRGILQDSLRLS